MTSTEFMKWVRYLEWRDVEEFRREDYYLAQIAVAVERGHVKNPSKIQIKDKLLKFTTSPTPSPARQSQVRESKTFWRTLTNTEGGGSHRQSSPCVPTSRGGQRQQEHGKGPVG